MTTNVTNTNAVRSLDFAGIRSGAGFDGDSLMAYCSTQLNSLQGDIKARMTAQQGVRDAKTALNGLNHTLANFREIAPNDAAEKRRVLEEYAAVLKSLPPGSKAYEQVKASLQEFRSTACYNDAKAPDWVPGTSEKVGIDADVSVPDVDGKNKVNAEELKKQVDALGDVGDELGKNAELEMIDLQQLISQRQMAIQMTTNMMNKCSQGPETIAANIGK